MNTEKNSSAQGQSAPQKQQTANEQTVQVSLPATDETQTGPFEHSGQTEEASEEEKEQKKGSE